MRIDKFLSAVNITKRRSISEDMCKSGVVSVNGVLAKASKIVKIGDKISINLLTKKDEYEVLALPSLKNTPKSKQSEYIKKI